MNTTQPLRVLIVDDHAMVRTGLKDFIYAFDWMEPVGEVENGAEAVEFCRRHPVDVVLMDLVMPLMDGVEATRQIKALGKPLTIIILTSFQDQEWVQKALKAGATSYILKNVSADELAGAIRAAHGGLSILAPEVTAALLGAETKGPPLGSDLTDEERAILGMLARGATNAEIAARFSFSVAAVKYKLAHIFKKLDAKNRVEAARIALDHHLTT